VGEILKTTDIQRNCKKPPVLRELVSMYTDCKIVSKHDHKGFSKTQLNTFSFIVEKISAVDLNASSHDVT
jgi:hypothetical protein